LLADGDLSGSAMRGRTEGIAERVSEGWSSDLPFGSDGVAAAPGISRDHSCCRATSPMGLALLDWMGAECWCLRADCFPDILLEGVQLIPFTAFWIQAVADTINA